MKRPISGLMSLTVLLASFQVNAKLYTESNGNNQVLIKFCKDTIQKNAAYKVKSSASSDEKGMNGGGDGCTNQITLNKDFAPAGATLSLYPAAGGNTVTSGVVPSSGGGNQQPAPQPQPQPQKKTVSISKIENTAENSARYFMNQVVKVYGKIDNIRFNIREGFNAEESSFNAYRGDYTSLPAYGQGLRNGLTRGEGAGLNQGLSDGQSLGSQTGSSSARERFVSVVDKNQAPELTYVEKSSSYSGAIPSLSAPVPVRERLKDYDQEIADLANRDLNSVGIILGNGVVIELFRTNDYWSPSFKARLFDYWGDPAQTAYEFWKDVNKDPRLNLHETSEHDFLRDITSFEYETPSSNGEAFARAFRNEFRNLFASKWNDAVTRYDARWQREGRRIFQEAAQKYARDTGYNDGYTQSYRSASLIGFERTYAQAQQAGFESTVQLYSTKPQISQVTAAFENASTKGLGSARSDAPGDQIRLIVSSATNLATVPATLKVLVLNSEVGTYEVGASSKATTVKKFENVASTPAGFPFTGKKLTQAINVSGSVGPFTQTGTINVTLRGYLQKLGQMPAGDQQNTYANPMVIALKKEWDKEAGLGNQYNNKDCLLLQIAQTAKQINPQDRAGLKALSANLKSAYPAKRPGFLNSTRDDWDAAMALVDGI
jgi:hypothetical protein